MEADFHSFLEECGYTNIKFFEDGRYACLMKLLFTTAIITGQIGSRTSYDDRWCYHSHQDAAIALESWNGSGEPEGWHRHPTTGRRRKSDIEEVYM